MTPKQRPCWICGSNEGELLPSIGDNDPPPYHDACVKQHRAKLVANLEELIALVDSPPWWYRAWCWFFGKS